MIKSKYLSPIIAVFLVITIIFAIVITYLSDSFNIEGTTSKIALDYESKVFNKDEIMTVDIIIDEDSWSNLLENAIAEEYVLCDVVVNGERVNNVGIRTKGNTTLTQIAQDDTTDRYSFKIEFDQYVDQTLYGLDKLVLNNIMSDSTYMKEYLAYDMFDYMGVANPLYSFASITVNGEPWGLYFALEAMEESYALRNFGASYGQLYKPESVSMNGGMGNREIGEINFDFNQLNEIRDGTWPNELNNNTEAAGGRKRNNIEADQGFNFKGFGGSASTDLQYIDDNLDSYSEIFESSVFDSNEKDYKRVIEALKNISEGNSLDQYIDVEQTLKYFAVNSVLVNYDSYTGSLKHNYYLYESNGRLTMLPWDFNLAFAGFQSNDATSAINAPIDTPVSGASLSERPMIGQLLAVDEYMELYHEYLDTLMTEYFDSGKYIETIEKLDALISEYVKEDKTAFYTFDEYQKGVDTIKNFGHLRAESIKGQLNGTIPSTQEGQKVDSSKLIDASTIQIASMGTQGGAGGFPGNNPMNGQNNFNPNRNDFDNSQFNQEDIPAMGTFPNMNEMPDLSGMPDMNGAPNTDGMPDMNGVPSFDGIPDMNGESSFDGMPDMNGAPSFNGMPDMFSNNLANGNSLNGLNNSTILINIIVTAISILILLISLFILKKFKRRKYCV